MHVEERHTDRLRRGRLDQASIAGVYLCLCVCVCGCWLCAVLVERGAVGVTLPRPARPRPLPCARQCPSSGRPKLGQAEPGRAKPYHAGAAQGALRHRKLSLSHTHTHTHTLFLSLSKMTTLNRESCRHNEDTTSIIGHVCERLPRAASIPLLPPLSHSLVSL